MLFTEHHPDEFEAFLSDARGNRIDSLLVREYKPDHEHDEEVTSVGINTPGDLDLRKFQKWLSDLLANQGPDIFRMKGSCRSGALRRATCSKAFTCYSMGVWIGLGATASGRIPLSSSVAT